MEERVQMAVGDAVFALMKKRHILPELIDRLNRGGVRFYKELFNAVEVLIQTYRLFEEEERNSVTLDTLEDLAEWCEEENLEDD